MSLIHVARHGQSLGSFQEEEVREGFLSKRFLPEDLVWRDGMSDWQPLPEMADAWGWNAVSTTADAAPPSCTEPAWERRSEVGFFRALFQTIKGVLFHPVRTFSKMKTEGGMKAPLGFYVLMNFIVLVLVFSYQVPQFLKHPELLSPSLVDVSHAFIIIGFVLFALISPLFFMVGLFLSSSMIHLSLKMLGAAHQPWKATCRVFCYAFGSVAFFQFIPFGGLLTFFWGFVVAFLGLKKVHDCSTVRLCFSIVLMFVLFAIFAFSLLILLETAAHFYPQYFSLPK